MRNLADIIFEVRHGLHRNRIAFIGDSTTVGAGADSRAYGWAVKIAKSFALRGIPVQTDSLWGYHNFSPAFDTRISVGTGWVAATAKSVGGAMWLNSSTAEPLSFTPDDPRTDTFDIWYLDDAAFGAFEISDGINTVTVTPTGTNGITKATLGPQDGTTPGPNTFSIVKTGASSQIIGFEAYDSTTPKLALWNMGWGGSRSTTWADMTYDWSPQSALRIIHPDASLIDLGINDYHSLTTSISIFGGAMLSLLTDAQARGPAGLIVPEPSAVSIASAMDQMAYGNVLRALTTDLPLVDIPEAWGSWVSSNARGMMRSEVHPNSLGYNEKASLVYTTIFSELVQ